jgi:hypothetical protein
MSLSLLRGHSCITQLSIAIKKKERKKTPKINNLKEEMFIFGPWFQKFQTMVTWLHCFGPVVRQEHVEGTKLLTSWWLRNKMRER